MKIIIALVCFVFVFISCKQSSTSNIKEVVLNEKKSVGIINESYELYMPINITKSVLILFGGYTEAPDDIIREFNILDVARQKNTAVLLFNFNQKLWLEESEKQQLAKSLQNVIL